MGMDYTLLDAKSMNKGNPRKNANIFSILSFWWLNKFLSTGYKRSIENNDLFPLLRDDKTETSTEKLQQTWAEESEERVARGKKPNGYGLFKALVRTLSCTEYLYLVGIALLRAISKVLQSAFLSLLLTELVKPDKDLWAYIYGVGICLSGFGEALGRHQLLYNAALMSLRWKSGTIGVIYMKVRETLHFTKLI